MEIRFREFLEAATSAVAIACLWSSRAWLAGKLLLTLEQAWCRLRQWRIEEETAMTGKFGIANLMIVTTVLASLGNIAGKSMEDGKVDGKDLALLPEAVMIFPLAVQAEWTELVPEATDLDEAEQAQLLAHFKEKFNIPQDDLETKIEDVLGILKDGASLVMRLISVWQTKKTALLAA